jgi:hypothetical protein
MAISTVQQLGAAYDSRYTDFLISKASLANAAAGQYFSLWTAAGLPGTGTAPGGVGSGPVTPDNTTTGAINFMQQTSPLTSYLAELELSCANATTTFEIHDRLAHQSGFVTTTTTAQIAAFDLVSLLSSLNIDERKGDANYSDVQWWLEWYVQSGGTASNATVNVTFNDGTTGNLTVVAVGGTIRVGRCIPLNSLIAAADQGKFIRGVNNITLSASTGTAGNFGITATRYRCGLYAKAANKVQKAIWENLSLPEIYNSSCLSTIAITNTNSTGIINASGRIVHG